MRDTHATGIGSIMGAGTAGYCVGNLQLDDMPLPGEDADFAYPLTLASPLQVPPTLPNHPVKYKTPHSLIQKVMKRVSAAPTRAAAPVAESLFVYGWQRSFCRHS